MGSALGGCLGDLDGLPDSDDSLGGDDTPDAADTSDAADTPVDEQVLAHERAIHDRVNEVRGQHDLGRLEYDETIATIAREHSADMAERDYFAHESPGGEGPDDRLADVFPEHCREIGENIATVGRRSDDDPDAVAQRIVSGWMDSPGHRENLLREAFDEEGIGVAFADDGRVLATQNYCSTWNGFGG